MTDHQFSILWGEASTSPDRAVFVSDSALSAIWDDPEGSPVPADRLRELDALWTAVHTSIKDMRQALGLSRPAFSARFLVPIRTLENWESGASKCPEYVRLALLQAAGLYTRA